ncbi:MAG: hypothetical protein NVS9B10_04440 [Nevskia sp.]
MAPARARRIFTIIFELSVMLTLRGTRKRGIVKGAAREIKRRAGAEPLSAAAVALTTAPEKLAYRSATGRIIIMRSETFDLPER